MHIAKTTPLDNSILQSISRNDGRRLLARHDPPLANSILQSLPRKDGQRLFARHDHVDLTYGDVLCEPGKPLLHVYFPNDGIISLLTPVEQHSNVEVGMVGNEGMAGLALLLGVDVSPVKMLVQGDGTALRIKANAFRLEVKRNPTLLRELNLYLYRFMVQVAQTAGCNRFHETDQRLARWLLMTHDRVRADEFQLTHEFLAQMLGTRRAGITLAAGMLQKKNLIHYSRGRIIVVDRKGLERAACKCYRAVNLMSKHANGR
jgi:CRP-like cAMP-binding protein